MSARSLVLPLIVLATLVPSGCSVSGGRLAVISTEIPEGLDRSRAVSVEGENHAWIVFGLGGFDDQVNVEKAVRNALASAPGTNLLLNARLYRVVTGLDHVFCTRGILVRGEAVTYTPKK
ncbi:hypothetical protein HY251_04270 [bacterium]|nr:hypothetical protein [bacterium]